MNGPPGLYACWRDETKNADLKAWASAAHFCVFHERVLSLSMQDFANKPFG